MQILVSVGHPGRQEEKWWKSCPSRLGGRGDEEGSEDPWVLKILALESPYCEATGGWGRGQGGCTPLEVCLMVSAISSTVQSEGAPVAGEA